MGPPAGTKPDARAMLAGGISGAIEMSDLPNEEQFELFFNRCITYPIEYTKTMQQLADKKVRQDAWA